MGQWTIALGQLTLGHGEHGNGSTSQGDNAQWDLGKLAEWDRGAVGQCGKGLCGQVSKGHVYNVTLENETRGQSERGAIGNGTVDQ